MNVTCPNCKMHFKIDLAAKKDREGKLIAAKEIGKISGQIGGRISRRVLTSEQARAMRAVRTKNEEERKKGLQN